jgi:hypothetical protein
MVVIVQALLLALSSLILRKYGATYSGAIGGLLTTLWNLTFAPLSFGFAVFYGILIDSLFVIFRVITPERNVSTLRITIATTLATVLVGTLSYYSTVHLIHILPPNPVMEVTILTLGIVGGVVAGLLTSIIWNRYLEHLKL